MKAMNLKAILLAVSLIGASASAFAHPVVSVDLNSAADAENYNFEHNTLINGGGAINDWFSFDVFGNRDLSASLSGTSSGSIAFTAFNLYDAQGGNLLSTGDIFALNAKLSFAGLSGSVEGPATYWINIVGTYSGNATYSGTIAAAVPEPSTYGMLALGLGLIGFAARSRSKFSA
ncbi:FxDxF family PEP-CTERM protein [Methylobacillus arboreus]|uniref:FxDxF family PEP-CTERM protein n=1 Tax=Methylobacillus arboreus TaxID=755170 RepID=UPI001E2CF8C6|nr:FxDxF family PEP-CTERM protein [Methylobacillus arboreus]MCB5189426.1 FxDxF family PEP-CTERM protein [Methylobacillus arboreus]